MPTTLSKGFKIFAKGERGWWDAMTANLQRLNDHTHDGLNSQLVSTAALNKGTSDIPAGSWAAVAGKAGLYSQVVTLPVGYSMATLSPMFYANGGAIDGARIHTGIEKVTDTSYRVYCNDNTLTLKAVYA